MRGITEFLWVPKLAGVYGVVPTLGKPILSDYGNILPSNSKTSTMKGSTLGVQPASGASFVRWRFPIPMAFFCLIVLCASAHAQDGLKLHASGGTSGLGFYKLGHWGVVRSEIYNRRAIEAQPMLAVNLLDPGYLQFCSRPWLPPHAKRVVYTPVLPLRSGQEQNAFELEGRLITMDSAGRERAAPPMPSLLLKLKGSFQSGVLSDSEDDWARKMQSALRNKVGLAPATSYIQTRNAPRFAPGWTALNGVMLSKAAVDLELGPDQFGSLRHWVLDGGRVWIMLDEVHPDLPKALFGENWDLVVLDRVGLTEFVIAGKTGDHECRFDYPVEMLRVIAPSFETLQTVRGYPVSLRKQVGRGQVLVTTLAARGWVDPKGKQTDAIKPLTWFMRKAKSTGGGTDSAVGLDATFADFSRDQIGYQILSRGLVFGVLAAFAGLILLTGLALSRAGRLEYVGLVGVVLAAAAAVVLIVSGLSSQGSTPTTFATAQLVQVAENQPFARVSGLLSVYTAPQDSDRVGQIQSSGGGVAWPDLATQGGDLLRVTWTDPEHYRLERLVFPPGAVRVVSTVNHLSMTDPPVAEITFNGEGVVGKLDPGMFGQVEDALIATDSGRISPRFLEDDEQRFVATLDDTLAPGQFLSTTLLDQTRISRQNVYRQLLSDPDFCLRPSLLAWAEPMTHGVTYTASAAERGGTLLVVPLKITRPESGQAVALPAAMITMTPYRAPGVETSTIYDVGKRKWVENISQEATVLMHFDLPAAIKPITLHSAILTVKLRAPGRPVDVITYRDGQARTLGAKQTSIGQMQFELSGEHLPAMAPDGGVLVGIRVGPYSDPTQLQRWSLSQMDLSVTGEIK